MVKKFKKEEIKNYTYLSKNYVFRNKRYLICYNENYTKGVILLEILDNIYMYITEWGDIEALTFKEYSKKIKTKI